MLEIAAIIEKELKTIARDPVGLFMLFALPAIFIVVLSVALQGAFSSGGSSERMEILALNQDGGELGERILDGLDKTGIFKTVRAVDERSGDDLKRSVEQGAAKVALLIPKDATDAASFKNASSVEILVDPAVSKEVAYAIKSAVENIAHLFFVERLNEERGGDPKKASPAGLEVKSAFVSGAKGDAQPNEVQQNVPGWTIFALFWISQLLALSILGERLKGSYRRILLSPVSAVQYLAGKTVPFLIINLVQAVFMFSLGIVVLPLLGCSRLEIGSLPALALVTVAISLVANGFGVFMASVSKSETFVASISAALIIIMCVIGGIMVPKFVMPSYMQSLSFAVPHGWAIEAYQDIIVRGFGVQRIAHYLGILLGWALAFFSMGVLGMKRWKSFE